MDNLNSALATMYSGAPQAQKAEANTFLQDFQKSHEAWQVVHDILANPDQHVLQTQMFAAQTLRNKITYDLSQIPPGDYDKLKNSLIELLPLYAAHEYRLVRTQLNIALSQLALQYLQWDNATEEVISKLSSSMETVPTLLEFLRVLPEELSEVKKTSLTDEEFYSRTDVLISRQVERVVGILANLAEKHSDDSQLSALVLDALNSWIKECPIESIVTVTPLTNLVYQSLLNEATFDKAVDCLITILRETRDITNDQLINSLFESLLQIRDFFFKAHKDRLEDPETVEQLTRLYVEAGESWHVLIAKNPEHFMPLVQILAELTKFDEDLDVVKYTFPFWFELKQLITLPKFEQSKMLFSNVYAELIETLIKHLTYPLGDNDNDLFDGDKESEDKFKEFRYDMGDVLKDCCAVVGATRALSIPYDKLQALLSNKNPSTARWQYLESPLFSLRTMAKEVPLTEKSVLPNIMSLLVQLPEHPKLRYAATLVLGRYTEWTSRNSQYLEPQLNYIIMGFQVASGTSLNASGYSDIVVAASRALMFFCLDCSNLLVNYIEQLYHVYDQIKDHVDKESHYELAQGLACVMTQVPQEAQYNTAEKFIGPTLTKLAALQAPQDHEVASVQLEVLNSFVMKLAAKSFEKPENAFANFYITKIWPVLTKTLLQFGSQGDVNEHAATLIKSATQAFSTYLLPILGEVATLLHEGFAQSHAGCFLWASGVLVREYGDEYCDDDTKNSIYNFAISQCSAFFTFIGSSTVNSHIDLMEDFYRMAGDILMFFPEKIVSNDDLMALVLKVSEVTLSNLVERQPLIECLHFLIDLISWGLPHPPVSFFGGDTDFIRNHVKLILAQNGLALLKVVVRGVVFTFPQDLLQDANDLLLKLLTVMEAPVAIDWLQQAVSNLPDVNDKELEKLMSVVSVALPNRDNRRVRSGLKDFVTWYTRKNVTPRTQFT
ncbi:mRNA transport regulator Mtr10p [Diutina rugosa]